MTNDYLEALHCMEKARDILKNKAREEDGGHHEGAAAANGMETAWSTPIS